MFWDRAAWVYDIFADIINRKANKEMCAAVVRELSSSDTVLECACGTGLLSGAIAKKCSSLVATDFSIGMLKRAEKKYKNCGIRFERADILHLDFPDENFDAVVAANVIHLLDEPYRALRELDRVCRRGGKIVVPTYMNCTKKGKINGITAVIGKAGVDFKREFTPQTYEKFFTDAGYTNVRFTFCEGKIPCSVAVAEKK